MASILSLDVGTKTIGVARAYTDAQFQGVAAAVLKQCDALDGLAVTVAPED